MRARTMWAALAAGWMLATLPAAAQPSGRTDPVYEAARAAFEGLDEAQRRALQEALVWTGDYNGTVGTTFGRRTFEAIQAVQRRAKVLADGVLDDRGRAALLAAAAREKTAAGFALTDDARAGVRIGIPGRLLREVGAVPGPVPGTRWQSADEKVTLDTRRYEPDGPTLPELYERIVAAPVRGRTITYKILRPDFFVVQGETQTGKFFIRSQAGPEGVRGFSIGYDKALAKTVDRLVIAVTNSFEAFPSAAVRDVPQRPGPVPLASAGSPVRSAGAGTVLVVGPGRGIVPSAALAACPQPSVGGRPARLERADAASGLSVIAFEAGAGVAVPLAAASDEAGAEVVVLARGGGERPLWVTPGSRGADGRIAAALQPGSAGALVLDRAGRLVGMVASVPDKPRLVAGVAPPQTYAVVAPAVLAGLGWQAGQAPDTTGAGLIAARLAPGLLGLECRR